MPLFSAVAGQALPAATYNLNVRNQVITTCTAATRPATPVEGQHIYETDTDLLQVWNGSAWQRAPWNVSWGTVGYAQVTANQGSISTTLIDLTGLTVTWVAVTGRRYRTSCYFNMIGNTAADIGEVLITDAVPTQLSAAVPPPINTTYAWSSGCSVVESGLSGSRTRKLMVRRIGGAGLLTVNASAITPAYILVEDIGPS